jgi:hypothetical protein
VHIEHGDDIGRLCGAGQHASYGTRFGCSVLCLAAAHRAWGGGGDLLIRWLQLRSVSRSQSAGQRTAILWLAVCTTILALILFALAPVNDLFNLLLCLLAVYFFRKPERNRVGQAVIIGAAFLALVLAPVVFRAANMWLPAEKIVLMNQPVAMVGYVLTTDARYATVLKAVDSTAQVLSLDDVESRTICRVNPGLESASLVRYIAGSASKRTRPC